MRSPGPEPNLQGKGPIREKATGKGGAVKGGKSDKGKGKGEGKQLDPKPQPGTQEKPVVKQRPNVELEPTCWGGRLDRWLYVVGCLEKGFAPRGKVLRWSLRATWMSNFCCIDQDGVVLSRDDGKTVMLPFRVDGSLEFRRCGLYQLGKTMPELPDGLVFDLPSKDVPRHVDLVTLRLRVPKSFVSVERWMAFKERPVEGAKEWLGKAKCHSVYGWREHTQKNWKGPENFSLWLHEGSA